MSDGTDSTIDALRSSIDAADDEILAALGHRVEAVRALHDHKQASGRPLADPGREHEIRERLTRAAGDGLSPDAVAALVDAVLAITRSEVSRLRGQDWG